MKSFLGWMNEHDKNLLKWMKSQDINLNKISEDSLRTGVKPQYPDAYARSQYPDAYFNPISATASLDIENSKKIKSVAAPKNTP